MTWKKPFKIGLLCAAWAFTGCGGRSVGGLTGRTDGCCAADPDGGPVVGEDGTVVGPFCSGADKVELGNILVSPPVVTTSPIVMDCCDGTVLHFHVSQHLGEDMVVMIRSWGGMTVPGEYDLGDPDPSLEAQVFPPGQSAEPSAPVVGTLRVEWEGADYTDPTLVTLCGRVEEAGVYEGLRIWVDRARVLGYDWWYRWGIFLLSDPALTAVEADLLPLSSLELDPEPVVHLGAIAFYRWPSHTVYWDVWYGPGRMLNRVPEVGVRGVPFVVMVDGERIYLGAFFTVFSSFSFDGPTIVVDQLPDTHFTIDPAYPGGPDPDPDPREDPRIQQILQEAGKLAP